MRCELVFLVQMNTPTIYIRPETRLPANAQWENRFEIRSESSERVYIVAQNINKRHWGCSCPGYKIHRKCKHLQVLALPCKEQPYEVKIAS